MSAVQVIMGHQAAQEAFNRHLPVWEKLGLPMLVFCPEDAPVETRHQRLVFGHACHHGPHSIERFRTLLLHLESTPHDQFLIQEYDSVSLEKAEIPIGVLKGNYFPEGDSKWFASFFLHPPLAFDRSVLHRLVAAFRPISMEAGEYFWDRHIAVLAEISKIEVSGWGVLGFSQNTIEPHQIKDAIEARKGGAIHWHGVKTKEVLDAILNT